MQKTFKIFTPLFLLASLCHAQAVEIVIPEVPKVPKVTAKVPTPPTSVYVSTSGNYKSNEEIIREATTPKVVHFSNHVAPVYEEVKDDPNKVALVGQVKNGQVTAYLHAPLITPHEVKSILEGAGFSVLNTFKVDKKGIVNSVIFTNDEIVKQSSKKNRGFASALRVTIDKKNKLISITNPIYVMAAFMQGEYKDELAQKTLKSLRDAFGNLENSEEKVKFRVLERYQFMQGMPKYVNMQVIKKAASATLLANARKSKKIVYEQKLLNGSVIIGVKLSKRTSRFIKKTGYQNAGLLPYPVLIENGEAKILDPKYYIAVMYPMLKMSQFMTIATVPGAIGKDVDKVFR